MEGWELIKEQKIVHKIINAKKFAEKAHADQMYGECSYIRHLDMVSMMVAPWGENAQVLAYLHDVVEDTEVTIQDIKDNFGQYMADCVELVTDCEGPNRKERKKKTNEKLSKVDLDIYPDVLIVKPGDRVINMGMCIGTRNKSLFRMYKNENEEFKKAVYRPGLCDKLWSILDYTMKFPL